MKPLSRWTLRSRGVTEGGVVRHQNNTWPIMAAGRLVGVTASVVIKDDIYKVGVRVGI